jgi:hypothetical protein
MRIRIKGTLQHLVLAISPIALFMSCVSRTELAENERREVVVYSHCSTEEASSDVQYSVNELREQLTKKRIAVKRDDKKKLCGYLLVKGPKTKKLRGALTDVELLQKINTFFGPNDLE